MENVNISTSRYDWENFSVTNEDLEFIYNHLLEVEKPQTSEELLAALVDERLRLARAALVRQQQAAGDIYYPKEHYAVGQTLQFPHLNGLSGTVLQMRPGQNPDIPGLEVIEVGLTNGETRMFAAGVAEHVLNQPVSVRADNPQLDRAYVLEQHAESLSARLEEVLQNSPDLVRIAWMWFPRALLVDMNVGHLNLAEAVLDMMGGGPLSTPALMEQIDLPEDAGSNLNEFSLNLALQEDKRFDEVGAAGEILWFLHRLEPQPVRETPLFLRYTGSDEENPAVAEMLSQFDPQIIDELDPAYTQTQEVKRSIPAPVTYALLYPHWRAGSLPLAGALAHIFPTAYESPRVQFTFVDANSGEKFPGWVVRHNRYVVGMRDWYLSQGLIAGSILRVEPGQQTGEVVLRIQKKRPTRDWVRTAVVGSDGGVVFSMLKNSISAPINERMAIVVSDVEMLDTVWERTIKQRVPLAQTVRMMMRELGKLSPQIHVHAEELYAGINVLRRCPPGVMLSILLESSWAVHLGNLYFRLDDPSGGNHD